MMLLAVLLTLLGWFLSGLSGRPTVLDSGWLAIVAEGLKAFGYSLWGWHLCRQNQRS